MKIKRSELEKLIENYLRENEEYEYMFSTNKAKKESGNNGSTFYVMKSLKIPAGENVIHVAIHDYTPGGMIQFSSPQDFELFDHLGNENMSVDRGDGRDDADFFTSTQEESHENFKEVREFTIKASAPLVLSVHFVETAP